MITSNIFTRSALAMILALTAGAAGYLYFISGLYSGTRTEDVDFHFFHLLAIVALLIVVKLFIYDLIGSALLGRRRGKLGLRIFYAGYILALALDMLSVFMSFQPIYMNLSLFATIMYSPVILFVALIILAIYTFPGTKRAR